jgi:7-cyano-7-deazaguanine synthase
MKDKTVVLFSGGMDSTTLLYSLLESGSEVHALGINYGQRHAIELVAASEIAKKIGIPFEMADLRSITNLINTGSLTNKNISVPEGHYEANSMKNTVVANRNMILLSVATGWAITLKAKAVAYAAHAGDHAIYADCRPEFINAISKTIELCDELGVKLLTPFKTMSKADICKLGNKLGVPFALTWSCYKGQDKHCGKCGTCIERQEAFELAKVKDPTLYQYEKV